MLRCGHERWWVGGGDFVMLPAEHLNLLLEKLVRGWPREPGSEFKSPSVLFC